MFVTVHDAAAERAMAACDREATRPPEDLERPDAEDDEIDEADNPHACDRGDARGRDHGAERSPVEHQALVPSHRPGDRRHGEERERRCEKPDQPFGKCEFPGGGEHATHRARDQVTTKPRTV